MIGRKAIVCLLSWFAVASVVAADSITFTTLNCYWFIGKEASPVADKPRTTEEYSLKAGHLIGLLPKDAPLFIGLQEIGNDQDVQALAYAAKRRYNHDYRPLFVQGKDTATKQDVGALLDTTRGWGVYGRPARVAELEKALSKHMVLRLTNAFTHIDVCVVHLRRPMGDEGKAKQLEQNRALLRWSMRHLGKDPRANLIIMGDFNEGLAPGNPQQSLTVLFQAKPPLIDSFSFLKKARTHADGKAYDRILLSDALVRGSSGLRLSRVGIQEHGRGKGEQRRMYTDHFAVSASFTYK